MSSVSEIKEHRCPICWNTFDSEKMLPIVYSCGHSVCLMCDKNPNNFNKTCQVCRKPITSRVKNSSLIETLCTLDTMCNQIEELDNPDINFQCSSCQDWTGDENMHICKTCTIDEGLLELAEVPLDAQIKKVVGASMCSNCIVPTHALEGHTLVPMFPIWSGCNFSLQSSRIHKVWEQYEEHCKLLDQSFSDFKSLSIEVPESYNLLSDMAGYRKTIEKQNEIFEKMENFIDECISIHVTSERIVRRSETSVQIQRNSFMSKLEKFENVRSLLDKTISSYKLERIESTDEYNIMVCLATTCNTKKDQKETFDKMENFIAGIKQVNDNVRSKFQHQMGLFQESLTKIKEWWSAEMDHVEESDDDDDSSNKNL